MRVYEINEMIETYANPSLAEEWDNVGFQIGNDRDWVTGILLAMDMDESTYNLALEQHCNLVITHHPLIFDPLRNVTNRSYKTNLIMKMIVNNMSLIVAHTNLDAADEGVNDSLAKQLGLSEISKIRKEAQGEERFVRFGNLPKPLDYNQVVSHVRECFSNLNIRVGGHVSETYQSVYVSSGSGSFALDIVSAQSGKLLITADVKYHDYQKADELGITIIDLGHFHSESHVLKRIKTFLSKSYQGPIYIKETLGFHYEEY